MFVVDSKLEKRPVTFGKAGTAATMLCVCHSPKDDLCFTGSDTGLVYVWQGTTLYRSVQAHKGPVCAMYSLSQSKQQVRCLRLAHFGRGCLHAGGQGFIRAEHKYYRYVFLSLSDDGLFRQQHYTPDLLFEAC